MEKIQVVEINDSSITFSSLSDMENAYNQLADGKDIIIFKEDGGQRTGEIFPGRMFSEIMDGKLKLITKEKI